MANDLKLGSLDVADVRFGSTQVSKVMLGSTEVWTPGGAPPPVVPTLTDSFTALDPSYASGFSKPFTASKIIPVGTLLVVGVGINGVYPTVPPTMTDNSSQAGAANSYVRLSGTSWVQGTNVSGVIFVCRTTRQINIGNIITIAHTDGKNRGVAVVAWFDAAIPSLVLNGGDKSATGNSSTWNTGTQAGGLITTAPTLDLALAFGTSGALPWGFGGGYTEIGEIVTAAGSAERSCGLGYRVSPAAGAKSASGTCTTAVWGCGMVNLAYTP